MKNILAILSILAFVGFSTAGYSQCKANKMVKANRPLMKPYIYDGYATNDVNISSKREKVEVEFTAFGRQKYRLVFATSGFTEKSTLNVYDKSSRVKTRAKIYTNDKSIDKAVWSITPSKTTTYFIEYDIDPSSNGGAKKECVVMIIGYGEGTEIEE